MVSPSSSYFLIPPTIFIPSPRLCLLRRLANGSTIRTIRVRSEILDKQAKPIWGRILRVQLRVRTHKKGPDICFSLMLICPVRFGTRLELINRDVIPGFIRFPSPDYLPVGLQGRPVQALCTILTFWDKFTYVLEIRDSQNLANLREGCAQN